MNNSNVNEDVNEKETVIKDDDALKDPKYFEDDEIKGNICDDANYKTEKNTMSFILAGCVCVGLIAGGATMLLNSKPDNKQSLANGQSLSSSSQSSSAEKVEDTSSNNEEQTSKTDETETENNIIEKYSSKNYIISTSSSTSLTLESLNAYSAEELCIARNELLARKGYVFTSAPKLQKYFESKSWYSADSSFNGELTSTVEKNNSSNIAYMEFIRNAYDKCSMFTKDYAISDSKTRVLTEDEISKLNDWQLEVAKNELYARYGIEFEEGELYEHFSSRSWYKIVEDLKKVNVTLNNTEKANLDAFTKEENKRIEKFIKRDVV